MKISIVSITRKHIIYDADVMCVFTISDFENIYYVDAIDDTITINDIYDVYCLFRYQRFSIYIDIDAVDTVSYRKYQ